MPPASPCCPLPAASPCPCRHPAELPTVLRNDEADWPAVKARLEAGEFDNVVISPGPGTPQRAADVGEQACRSGRVRCPLLMLPGWPQARGMTVRLSTSASLPTCIAASPAHRGAGISLALLQAQLPVPTLGVCLGFQALALAHGGTVRHAPEPVHGRLSGVRHSGHPLFKGIPSGPEYAVVRTRQEACGWQLSSTHCPADFSRACGSHHVAELWLRFKAAPPPSAPLAPRPTRRCGTTHCSWMTSPCRPAWNPLPGPAGSTTPCSWGPTAPPMQQQQQQQAQQRHR